MQRLTQEEFKRLTDGAKVLSRDRHGDKVLQAPEGTIYKLFRLKRVLSTASVVPHAVRFERAACELTRRGVETVEVSDVFRVRALKRDVVAYGFLEGEILRDALTDEDRRHRLIEHLLEFVVNLHAKGVFFRGMHFANLLVTPEGGLGLIDVSETRFRQAALRPRLRARNFKHMLRYEEDAQALRSFGLDRFLKHYLEQADLSSRGKVVLLRAAGRSHPLLSEAVERLDS